MKIRNILMKALLASVLTVSQNLLFVSDSNQAKAQGTSRSRPYIVLVNGWGNCCTWGRDTNRRPTPNILDKVVGKLPPNTEIRYVPYSNFVNSGTSGNSSTDEQFLRDGADFINKLDRNRPLILIGHSFGGDSVIKLLPRINRRIQFVAVIDPVTTAGFRKPLTRSLGVGGNVDYFFNRWQENVPFPNDFRTNGKIPCIASRCDQESQNLARSEDGSTKTIECSWAEISCPDFVAPNPFIGRKGKKGRKQVRTGHQDLPKDAYIQRILGDRIVQSLASFRPPSTTPTASTPSNPSSYKLGFYRQGNQDAVHLVFRPNGRHCHVQNADQMSAYGGSGQVSSIAKLNFANSSGGFSGECGFPNGFYRLGNQDEVYRLYGSAIPEFDIGSSFCQVANRQQMDAFGGFGQIRSVATASDLGRGRDDKGDCQNP